MSDENAYALTAYLIVIFMTAVFIMVAIEKKSEVYSVKCEDGYYSGPALRAHTSSGGTRIRLGDKVIRYSSTIKCTVEMTHE